MTESKVIMIITKLRKIKTTITCYSVHSEYEKIPKYSSLIFIFRKCSRILSYFKIYSRFFRIFQIYSSFSKSPESTQVFRKIQNLLKFLKKSSESTQVFRKFQNLLKFSTEIQVHRRN